MRPFQRALSPLLLFVWGDAQDSTPPVLTVVDTQAFIFHFLLTVTLDEDGAVYCGSLPIESSYTPSIYQMVTGENLVGHGSAQVPAGAFRQIIISSLSPGSGYDIFCYAEDAALNGFDVAGIAASLLPTMYTASGGDYTPPTLSYVPPYEVLENTAVSVYVQLSEDGTVWCAAVPDLGAGTSAPTSGELQNNMNVFRWASLSMVAEHDYKAGFRFTDLDEDSLFDVYCFARDMSGNGIDGTPAWIEDPDAIANTKRAGLRTLTTLRATRLEVTNSAGVRTQLDATPATWNLLMPSSVRQGSRECRDLVSRNAPLALSRMLLANHAAQGRASCAQLPPAPRFGAWLALALRGGCPFAEKAGQTIKARRASRAGYSGLIVIDHQSEPHLRILPEMTAHGRDAEVTVPGWLVSATDGATLASAATTSELLVDVQDIRRKPRLANLQSDIFGLRIYAAG